MSSIPRPGDVGFAQFTAALIVQTLDAVISAQLGQEERLRKLQEAAGLAPDELASEIQTEDVEAELARLFPAGEYPKGIAPGAPYAPSGSTRPEDPPIAARTGYATTQGDWVTANGVTTITEAGYRNILSHIRTVLAARRLSDIRQMLLRGVPRVVVDHGRVNAKLFFQFVSTPQPALASNLRTVMLPQLVVRPVELQRPEVARLTVNVVGEVDITFKTVSE